MSEILSINVNISSHNAIFGCPKDYKIYTSNHTIVQWRLVLLKLETIKYSLINSTSGSPFYYSLILFNPPKPPPRFFFLFFFFFSLFLWLCNSLRCYSLKPKKYGHFYEPLRHTLLWHTILFSNLIGVLRAEWTMFRLTCAIFFNKNIKQTKKKCSR